ncbi:MAG: hypothetical protein K2Q10_03345, partial [Rhodospirillales bacterium]|nr:hypothetical protein [Rhodospirillales bacterium]
MMALARRTLSYALAACLTAGTILPAHAQSDGKTLDTIADTAAKSLLAPDSAQEFGRLVSPQTLTGWVQFLSNKDTIEALLAQSDPANLTRWVEVMTNPALIENMLKAGDPKLIQQWV